MASHADYLDIDGLLTEDQRLVRDTVGSWVDDKVLPIIEDAAWEGRFPRELVPEMAAMSLFGSTIAEYGLPGPRQHLLRPDHAGARARRLGPALLRLRPVGPRDVSDLRLRLEGAEGQVDPEAREGRGARLLRPDRAGLRLQPRRDAHDREEGRRLLRPERRQGLDHQRLDRRRRRRLGEARRRRSAGFLVEKGTKGFSTFEHKGKMSLRASVTSQLAFEDCRIPAENILPGVEGLKGPLSCLTQARYGIAWGALGSAMATYQAARSTTPRAASSGRTARSPRTSSSRSAWPG